MERIIGIYVGGFFNVLTLIYICSEILSKKLELNNKKLYFYLLIITIYIGKSYELSNGLFRIMISIVLVAVACLRIFKEKVIKSSLTAFIAIILLAISEIIIALFFTSILQVDINFVKSNYFATLTSNIFVSTLSCLIISFKGVKNMMKKFVTKINDISNIHLICFISIILLIYLCLMYSIYYQTSERMTIFLTLILIISFTILMLTLLKEKSENNELMYNKTIMLNDLTEYEKMYFKEKNKSHENKNDLMIIRGMISDEKAQRYIDNLLEFNCDIGINNYDNIKIISSSLLKGLLLYKIDVMKKKNINVIFQISERMNTLDFSILDDDLQAKICKVIAIFIDNAIECVNQSSYKYIWINFRKKNRNIIITIVNNYERKFDGDLLYVEGYTTKEKGHGIGLSIAKRIIDSDFRINNITKIIGSNFCQEIIIKMP